MIEIDWLRVLFAFFCGYFLSLSGSLAQIVSNNDLASPSTLGFDALAALCIIAGQGLLTFTGINIPLEWTSFILFCLFFGAAFKVLNGLALKQSSRIFSLDIKLLVLIGLAFNLLVGAIFAVVQFLFMAMNWEFPSGLWFGNFRFYHSNSLILFTFAFAMAQVFLSRHAGRLRLLALGEGMAMGLGVKVDRSQKASILLSLFLTGLVVSFFGVFSFLSLIIPHMLRLFGVFRANLKNELIFGPALAGFALAVLDYLCFRFDYYGAELPVGMISSVAGSFLLIILLWKSRFKTFAKD